MAIKALLSLLLLMVLTQQITPTYGMDLFDKEPLNLSQAERDWLEAHPTLSVAFDGDFPPYSFRNESGELEGISVDIFRIIGRVLGVEWSAYPDGKWNSLYLAAKEQKVDVVATMVKTPEREALFHFTSPYIFKSLVIVTRDDDQTIGHRDDIAGKTIALVKGYQYVSQILQDYPDIKPIYTDTMREALEAVSIGNADAAITFVGAAHYYRTKFLITNLKYATIFNQNHANERIAVRKDWPMLAMILNKAIRSIPERVLQNIRSQWLPVSELERLREIHLTPEEQLWIKHHPTVRYGIDPEFEPFEFVRKGRYEGISLDYLRILERRLNINFEVVRGLSWAQVMKRAREGKIDLLPAVGISKERRTFLNFTEPYLNFNRVVISRSEMPFISSLDEISHRKIGVQENSSHQAYLRDKTDIQPILYPSLQAALLALSGGEVEAIVGNVASSTYWIRKLNLTNLKIAAPISSQIQKLHIAVRKDWPELVPILQKGLDSISPQERKRISEKWLSVKYEEVVDYSLLWALGSIFAIVLAGILLWVMILRKQVKRHSQDLMHSTHYDRLTNLPNRFLMMERLQQAIHDARLGHFKVALLSVDLVEFKTVNEVYGHKAGDRILKKVGSRLSYKIGEHNLVGRLSGDRFLVILSQIEDATDAAQIAENLHERIAQPLLLGSRELPVAAYIGIAIYPEDGHDAETLLKSSDLATHYCKQHKKGGYAFYTEEIYQKVSRRLEVEQHMRNALSDGQFQVYYQPKVDATKRQLVSFEALLRWDNPELGSVSPAEFIPIAEKNGAIHSIGGFVLREALAMLHTCHQHNPAVSMAINLSPVQFRTESLITMVEGTLHEFSVPPDKVQFEITEGVLLSDDAHIKDKLKQLKALKVALSMDDFGTGYSSMSYLRSYEFDELKIDREFIMELSTQESSRKLVAATIAMAHELGMKVVAEGVETEEQSAFLKKHKCDVFQGWLFSKALPEKAAIEMLINGLP